MADFTVVDRGGVWVVNPHTFSFVDPETSVRFSPGVPVKVLTPGGSWLVGQMAEGVIVGCEDPTGAARPPPKAADVGPSKTKG